MCVSSFLFFNYSLLVFVAPLFSEVREKERVIELGGWEGGDLGGIGEREIVIRIYCRKICSQYTIHIKIRKKDKKVAFVVSDGQDVDL